MTHRWSVLTEDSIEYTFKVLFQTEQTQAGEVVYLVGTAC